MPWKIVKRDEKFCVAKEDAEGNAGDIVSGGCHDTEEEAQKHMRALYANEADMAASPEECDSCEETTESLVALADYASYQPVQFLRTGTFTDANGNKVTISAEDLDKIVANFANGEAGQDVPIDIQHERREAAGWVSSITREGDRLIAQVNWTEFGRGLVADRIYKYLSATIDKARWVLKSISLVNFPAVKGLPAVELAEYVHEAVPPAQHQDADGQPADAVEDPIVEVSPMSEETKVAAAPEAPQPEAPPTPPATPETILSEGDIATIRTQMEKEMRAALLAEYAQLEEAKGKMFAELMAKVREEREVVEFSEAATNGGRHALPVKANDLKALLMDLPKASRTRVMDLLRRVNETGTVDFTEHGTTGKAVKKALEPDMATALRGHLRNGGSVDIFFDANSELGAKETYDLAEFGVGGNNG